MLFVSQITLRAGDIADDLDLPVAEVIAAAFQAGVQDFAAYDEPFEAGELAEIWEELHESEQDAITFALEDEQIEKFSWLTGCSY